MRARSERSRTKTVSRRLPSRRSSPKDSSSGTSRPLVWRPVAGTRRWPPVVRRGEAMGPVVRNQGRDGLADQRGDRQAEDAFRRPGWRKAAFRRSPPSGSRPARTRPACGIAARSPTAPAERSAVPCGSAPRAARAPGSDRGARGSRAECSSARRPSSRGSRCPRRGVSETMRNGMSMSRSFRSESASKAPSCSVESSERTTSQVLLASALSSASRVVTRSKDGSKPPRRSSSKRRPALDAESSTTRARTGTLMVCRNYRAVSVLRCPRFGTGAQGRNPGLVQVLADPAIRNARL